MLSKVASAEGLAEAEVCVSAGAVDAEDSWLEESQEKKFFLGEQRNPSRVVATAGAVLLVATETLLVVVMTSGAVEVISTV